MKWRQFTIATRAKWPWKVAVNVGAEEVLLKRQPHVKSSHSQDEDFITGLIPAAFCELRYRRKECDGRHWVVL